MRFAVVSDIHCNLAGLDAAIAACGAVDGVLCLGDVVLESRFSDEVVRRLRALDARVVLGNHDLAYLSHASPRDVAAGRVDAALVRWLAGLPTTLEFEAAGRRVLMTHAAPWTDDYVFPGSRDHARFGDVDADFVLGGHTHTPFVGRVGTVTVVNPGSAGQPRLTDLGPRLHCAVLDLAAGAARLVQFPAT